ncbi:uncharacterized protein IL334_007870 [Kwoniella shivajii]|uniref:Uncharacterized protein n=1 Tax=Kwoniella shivajii TaxID=564305 RepID=A0ABZ1D9V6_9TREE|nr:hypothetical protein IL334_007870 [Kwoniella shivajii]
MTNTRLHDALKEFDTKKQKSETTGQWQEFRRNRFKDRGLNGAGATIRYNPDIPNTKVENGEHDSVAHSSHTDTTKEELESRHSGSTEIPTLDPYDLTSDQYHEDATGFSAKSAHLHDRSGLPQHHDHRPAWELMNLPESTDPLLICNVSYKDGMEFKSDAPPFTEDRLIALANSLVERLETPILTYLRDDSYKASTRRLKQPFGEYPPNGSDDDTKFSYPDDNPMTDSETDT